jgi:NADH:quinone reductase (non-electrogenic)
MIAGLIRDVPTVQKLIDRIMNEPERLIRGRLTGFLDADMGVAGSRVTRRRARSTLRCD